MSEVSGPVSICDTVGTNTIATKKARRGKRSNRKFAGSHLIHAMEKLEVQPKKREWKRSKAKSAVTDPSVNSETQPIPNSIDQTPVNRRSDRSAGTTVQVPATATEDSIGMVNDSVKIEPISVKPSEISTKSKKKVAESSTVTTIKVPVTATHDNIESVNDSVKIEQNSVKPVETSTKSKKKVPKKVKNCAANNRYGETVAGDPSVLAGNSVKNAVGCTREFQNSEEQSAKNITNPIKNRTYSAKHTNDCTRASNVESTRHRKSTTGDGKTKIVEKSKQTRVKRLENKYANREYAENGRVETRHNSKTIVQHSVKINGSAGSEKSPPQNNKSGNKKRDKFPAHLSAEEVAKLLAEQQPENIEYVEGRIRINPKFFKKAYVTISNNTKDLVIDGILDRNRALEGDLVVVKINPSEKWETLSPGEQQKTAVVVRIVEKVHPRKIVGCLKPLPDKNSRYVLFSPRDYKVPRLNIRADLCPDEYHANPELYANTMILAEISSWDNVRFAYGKILQTIGEAGDLKAESIAILLDNDLDVEPYGPELTSNLPPSDYIPTADDLKNREDWRQECVFTIDPITARDLDDAVSCKSLENGNYQIGVHISDVTHYLEASSALDKAVSKRATTIYMTDSVYHMLPKELCNVCSLLPGQDKLAMSVIFEMTPNAEVVGYRFAKTVINSCCQLAYEHAQEMIDACNREWLDGELPQIHGKWSPADVSNTVNTLNKLAVIMREDRFRNGALKLDQPKLNIHLDPMSGLPVSFSLEERRESNKLIEEFMLLANNAAATVLYKKFPQIAMLRRHEPPLSRLLNETQTTLQKFGIHIDIQTAGTLQASLLRYEPDVCATSPKDYYLANCRIMVINVLCAKPIKRAEYFCSSPDMSEDDTRHYALNVPLYTHFTSPIRRYPDCVVHRLLYASILDEPTIPNWTPKMCSQIATNCNRKKYSAKLAQKMSTEFYMVQLLGMMGPITTIAIALDVRERSFDVIACSIGLTLRIVCEELGNGVEIQHSKNDGVQTLTLHWKELNLTQVINIFSVMSIRVGKHPTMNQLRAELLPPIQMNI